MPLIKSYAKLPIWLQFALNVLLLYGLWMIFYVFLRDFWLVDYIYEEAIYWLTKVQLTVSGLLLSLLNFDVEIIGKVIYVNNSNGVLLDRGCLGRNVLGLFVGFILAYPSRFRDKLPIIIIGIIVFLILNILRISALSIIDYCCPKYLDINHHYIFKAIVYSAILLMWYLWLKSLRPVKQPQEP